MLYNVTIGEKIDNNHWICDYNKEYKTYSLVNEGIHQRIRESVNLKDSKLNPVIKGDTFSSYEISDTIFFSNNNKNMNINIVNFWNKNPRVVENHVDDNIMYLTLSLDSYKLLGYTFITDNEILQTYHMKDKYVGCALVFHKEDDNLLVLNVRNNKTKKFEVITVGINNGKLVTKNIEVTDQNEVKTFINLYKRYKNFSLGFKMYIRPKKLITNTYITTIDKYEELKERVSKTVKNPLIIALESSVVEEFDEEEKSVLSQTLIDNKVRAVTLYDITLPKSFCKEFRILYIFDYNDVEDSIRCIRSN